MNREELIEEAAKALHRAAWGEDIAEPADPDYMAEMRRQAEMVLAVFEKAHAPTLHDLDDVIEDLGIALSDDAPTDDEREALARLFDAHWMTPLGKCACGWVHPQYGMRASHLDPIYVRQHLAYVVSNAGYRRSEVPEPSAEEEYGEYELEELDESGDFETQGEPSDAQVIAAVHAYREHRNLSGYMNSTIHYEGMRAALRAAGGVR